MTLEPDYVEFTTEDFTAVLAPMAALTDSLVGWINFEPAVDPDDVPPPRSGLARLLSGRGPEVPLATWTPGSTRRRRGSADPVLAEPPSVGVHHAAGPAAAARLEAGAHPVPQGWVVVQDHAKRGLVVAVPAAVSHADLLRWLLRAATILSTVPLDRHWRAVIYRP